MISPLQIIKQKGFCIFNAHNKFVHTHGHEYLELAYVQQGSMEHRIGGKRIILNPGDYYIVDYGVTHSYERISEERLLVRNFLFFPEFLDRSLTGERSLHAVMDSYLMRFSYRGLISTPTGLTFHDPDRTIQRLLDEISAEYRAEDYGYLECIRCTLAKVLILTMRKIGVQGQAQKKSDVVSHLASIADSRYKEKLQLKDLAQEMGYNASYLSQRFSQEMGMGFLDYLHRVRIEHSCHLLESTTLKISRIAQEVGYEGMKYFNFIFKKRLSVTPREFRSIHKKK